MLNPQEGGKLDAKRYYVILAKALDVILAHLGTQPRPQEGTAVLC